jgi:hypothetical protein
VQISSRKITRRFAQIEAVELEGTVPAVALLEDAEDK